MNNKKTSYIQRKPGKSNGSAVCPSANCQRDSFHTLNSNAIMPTYDSIASVIEELHMQPSVLKDYNHWIASQLSVLFETGSKE